MVHCRMIFISGGVRSGKSHFAEQLCLQAAQQQKPLRYIASGMITDDEMLSRVQQHRKDRASDNWNTLEIPIQLEHALEYIEKGDVVLWDCMTTWLANVMYEGWESGTPCVQRPGCMEVKMKQVIQTIEAIRARAHTLVIVSNEVLNDVPTPFEETKQYQQYLGALHQAVVARANVAIEMESGIPIFWKGEE